MSGGRADVVRADVELTRAEQQLALRAQQCKQRIERHRTALLIGGGLVFGFSLTAVRPAFWARAGSTLFGGAAWLMRSPAGSMLAASLWTSLLRRTASTPQDAATQSEPTAPEART